MESPKALMLLGSALIFRMMGGEFNLHLTNISKVMACYQGALDLQQTCVQAIFSTALSLHVLQAVQPHISCMSEIISPDCALSESLFQGSSDKCHTGAPPLTQIKGIWCCSLLFSEMQLPAILPVQTCPAAALALFTLASTSNISLLFFLCLWRVWGS